MHGLLSQRLCACNADAFVLVHHQRIAVCALGVAVQHHQRACTVGLNIDIGRARLLPGVDADVVAKPAKKAIALHRMLVTVHITLKAAGAGRHPHTPQKRLIHTMDGHFQNGAHKVLRPFRVLYHAQVITQLSDGGLLGLRQAAIRRRSRKAKAGRPLVHLVTAGAGECKNGSHG